MSTSSRSSSSDTPHFSLPPYSPGNGELTRSLSPWMLLRPCAFASTAADLAAALTSAPCDGVEGVEAVGAGVDPDREELRVPELDAAAVGVTAAARECRVRVRVVTAGVGVEVLTLSGVTADGAWIDLGLRAMPWEEGLGVLFRASLSSPSRLIPSPG